MPELIDAPAVIDSLEDDALAMLFDGHGDFPERVWLIERAGKYFSCLIRGVKGLGCFGSEARVRSFMLIGPDMHQGSEVKEVSFDEAREIAQSKLMLQVLYLLDDMNNPVIHHIR